MPNSRSSFPPRFFFLSATIGQAPKSAVTAEIQERAREGNFDRVKEILDEIVVPLYEIRNRRPGYKCSMIKSAMTLAGLKGGRVRLPLIELSGDDLADLEALMSRTGLLSAEHVGV